MIARIVQEAHLHVGVSDHRGEIRVNLDRLPRLPPSKIEFFTVVLKDGEPDEVLVSDHASVINKGFSSLGGLLRQTNEKRQPVVANAGFFEPAFKSNPACTSRINRDHATGTATSDDATLVVVGIVASNLNSTSRFASRLLQRNTSIDVTTVVTDGLGADVRRVVQEIIKEEPSTETDAPVLDRETAPDAARKPAR